MSDKEVEDEVRSWCNGLYIVLMIEMFLVFFLYHCGWTYPNQKRLEMLEQRIGQLEKK